MQRALRPLLAEDGPMLLRWRNLPSVSRYMYTDHVIDSSEHEAWLHHALARSDARYWIMTCGESDVGFASVTEISARHRTCSWALYVAEESARGQGMGAFTAYTVMSYVFDELGLRKLSCEVLASNQVALGLYESFGFMREGLFREQILKAQAPVDVHRMGILDREWAASRENHRRRLLAAGVLTV